MVSPFVIGAGLRSGAGGVGETSVGIEGDASGYIRERERGVNDRQDIQATLAGVWPRPSLWRPSGATVPRRWRQTRQK
jgi:hypothetical protein